MIQRITEVLRKPIVLRRVWGCHAEPGNTPPTPDRKPCLQTRDRRADDRLERRTLPECLVAASGYDEVHPTLQGVECQHPVWSFPICEVEILRMRSVRVCAIAPARDRERAPGADEHDLVAQVPALSRVTAAALEVRRRVRHNFGCAFDQARTPRAGMWSGPHPINRSKEQPGSRRGSLELSSAIS